MKKQVCLQCGDIGFKTDLIHCAKCSNHSIHRYCMDVMPKNKHESVLWLCDDCEKEKKLPDKSLPRKTKLKEKIPIDQEPNKNQEKIQNFSNPLIGFRKVQSLVHESDVIAMPLIRSLWTGNFLILHNKSIYKSVDGISAFMSSKACEKVHKEAVLFKQELKFELFPKSVLWPKKFGNSEPSDDNIALYFFPSLLQKQNEGIYDCLVFEMIRDDLAMMASVENAELLVFTSMDLAPRFKRFQGQLFLWGVLRKKKTRH
ncbi:hypothetical protein ACJIZ3_005119 [Penstemon smallii]|uniref:PHD-type domain-containing protein n=1 Tax=Penstemon smallii TaxID=265156 RepID=A0ABD3S3Z2_9LAMI